MSFRDTRIRARAGGRADRRPGHREPIARAGDPYQPPVRQATPPPPPPDWRSEIAGLSGLNVIAGIWLIIAPWVLGYSTRDPRWNDVVFGIIIGVIALIRASGAYRAEWLSWINAVIGVWIFVAAFTIDRTAVAIWNDIILGIIVFLLAVGSAEATAHLFPRRRGAPPLSQ